MITFDLDEARLANHIVKLAQITGKETRTVVEEISRQFVADAIKITPPGRLFDMKSENWKQKRAMGEARVTTDLYRRFTSPGQLRVMDKHGAFFGLSEGLRRMAARADARLIDTLAKLDINIEKVTRKVERSDHKSARDNRGRIKGQQKVLIGTDVALKKYIKAQVRRVGMMMHGWAACVRRLGVKRIPPWVMKQRGSPGLCVTRLLGDQPHIVVINSVPYAQEIGPRILDRARTNLLRNLPIQIEKIYKAINRKAMEGVK